MKYNFMYENMSEVLCFLSDYFCFFIREKREAQREYENVLEFSSKYFKFKS